MIYPFYIASDIEIVDINIPLTHHDMLNKLGQTNFDNLEWPTKSVHQ